MFDDALVREITHIARRLDVPLAALLAVAEVESGGRVLAKVGSRREPLIRFEGHYFDRLLTGKKRARARKLGLASPKAGRVKNPRGQAARWALLDRAVAVDRVAAYSSVSWGVGQVMGSHWSWLGYGSVDALVVVARSGVAGQVDLMARYIEKADLCGALRAGDFRTFARRYNGPGYARNRYDTRMAAAFGRWDGKLGTGLPEPVANDNTDRPMQFGARGADVRALQKALTAHGYALVADGLFGIKTDRALRRFQRARNLTETGTVGFSDARLLLGWSAAWTIARQDGTAGLRHLSATAAAFVVQARRRTLSIIRRLA